MAATPPLQEPTGLVVRSEREAVEFSPLVLEDGARRKVRAPTAATLRTALAHPQGERPRPFAEGVASRAHGSPPRPSNSEARLTLLAPAPQQAEDAHKESLKEAERRDRYRRRAGATFADD